MISREAANINFVFFYLTQPKFEPTIYQILFDLIIAV